MVRPKCGGGPVGWGYLRPDQFLDHLTVIITMMLQLILTPDASNKKTFVQQTISFAIIYKAKIISISLKTYRYRPTYSAALRSCTSLGGGGSVMSGADIADEPIQGVGWPSSKKR